MSQEHDVHAFINRQKFSFDSPEQTGRALKERAGITLADVLFRDQPHEDEVITDDMRIMLKNGDHFHSAPPANYGSLQLAATDLGAARFDMLPQPNGWIFLMIHEYGLPGIYSPSLVRLIVKLPPLFPDAAPDMFWISPHVRVAGGAAPQGTSTETLLGEQWQRFSWHLLPGAWKAGTSTLRDFLRCVRARFEKQD